MKLKRSQVRRLAIVTAIMMALSVIYYRATVPFHTAQAFVQLIHSGQIADAEAMILETDRDRLPRAYWARMAATQFSDHVGWSMSYTPQSLLNSKVAFWVNVPIGSDEQKDSSVEYCAVGRSIIIQNIDLTQSPE